MKKTAILSICDRSGSMASIIDDAIGGLNFFIEEQKKEEGEASLTLVLFDDQYDEIFVDTPIKDVPEITRSVYSPRGSTALLDAIGKGVTSLERKLDAMPEDERPEVIIVSVLTDGQENASREFNLQGIKSLIEEKRTKHNWVFMFLGAGEDSLKDAGSYGFAANMTSKFDATGIGAKAAYRSVSSMSSGMRGQGLGFADDADMSMTYASSMAEEVKLEADDKS